MKKFSNITGVKVGKEPELKVDKKINEQEQIKYKILELMEQFLFVRTYGPVDRYQRAGNITIAGKEVFLEAILNLFTTKSLKDQTKLLEGLKSEIGNWELIDAKVSEFNNKIEESVINNNILIQKNNILKTYSKYGQDEELFIKVIEESCSKIKSKKLAKDKAISASLLSKELNNEVFLQISEKFENRFNQLSNKA